MCAEPCSVVNYHLTTAAELWWVRLVVSQFLLVQQASVVGVEHFQHQAHLEKIL